MNFIRRGSRVLIQNNSHIKGIPKPSFFNYLTNKDISYFSRNHGEEEKIQLSEKDTPFINNSFMLIYNESGHHQEQRMVDIGRMTSYLSPCEKIILNLEPDYPNIMMDPFEPVEDLLVTPIVERLDVDIKQFNLISGGIEKEALQDFIENIYQSLAQINFTYLHIDTLLLDYSGNAFQEELLPGNLHQVLKTILNTQTLGVIEFTNTSNNPNLVQSLSKTVIKHLATQN